MQLSEGLQFPRTNIFIFPSSHTQLKVQGKIGYMVWLKQATIRPRTIALKEKIKTASRCEISHLYNLMMQL
jgi:hypothetical protein